MEIMDPLGVDPHSLYRDVKQTYIKDIKRKMINNGSNLIWITNNLRVCFNESGLIREVFEIVSKHISPTA
jgi:hypothetical protein